jgi:hypothetical protein
VEDASQEDSHVLRHASFSAVKCLLWPLRREPCLFALQAVNERLSSPSVRVVATLSIAYDAEISDALHGAKSFAPDEGNDAPGEREIRIMSRPGSRRRIFGRRSMVCRAETSHTHIAVAVLVCLASLVALYDTNYRSLLLNSQVE